MNKHQYDVDFWINVWQCVCQSIEKKNHVSIFIGGIYLRFQHFQLSNHPKNYQETNRPFLRVAFVGLTLEFFGQFFEYQIELNRNKKMQCTRQCLRWRLNRLSFDELKMATHPTDISPPNKTNSRNSQQIHSHDNDNHTGQQARLTAYTFPNDDNTQSILLFVYIIFYWWTKHFCFLLQFGLSETKARAQSCLCVINLHILHLRCGQIFTVPNNSIIINFNSIDSEHSVPF